MLHQKLCFTLGHLEFPRLEREPLLYKHTGEATVQFYSVHKEVGAFIWFVARWQGKPVYFQNQCAHIESAIRL
jgi:hypothetical protein